MLFVQCYYLDRIEARDCTCCRRIGDTRNLYRILVRKSEVRRLEDLDIDGRGKKTGPSVQEK
jgi:predicted RNA-binding protein YlxR (DUF448 family)